MSVDMSIDKFWRGEVVPVAPSAAVITTFMLNGWTHEDVARALSQEPWDAENFAKCPDEPMFAESPLEAYKGGVGYQFEWGHVIECFGAPVDDYVPNYCIFWEFCLDDILTKFHQEGRHLDELSDLCLDFIESVGHKDKSWQAEPSEGDQMSCFAMHIITQDASDKAAQEVETARQWMAKFFLIKVVPDLLEYLETQLTHVNALQ